MNLPGPVSQKMLGELSRYVIAEPWPFTVDIEKSRGMWIVTADGERLFDWSGMYGSKLLGYNPPCLEEPAFAKRLLRAAGNRTANPDFLTEECLDYYRLLHRISPRCMRNPKLEVYAVNSGAEAVENMMKYLINLHDVRRSITKASRRNRRFLYFDQAFHGRTIFALNITQLSHDPIINKNFSGFVPGNLRVEFPAIDVDLLPAGNHARTATSLDVVEHALSTHPGEVVAIIVEPLQGAGGHRVAEMEFFCGLSELAHKHDTYLAFDEVQTAGGQCGDIFAADLMDLPHPPRAIAVAKKFGCGAVYMLEPMDDIGILDSTWGGSLTDMVRVVQEFKYVESENLIAQVPAKAERLTKGLQSLQQKHPGTIRNVRGLGLYQGFSLQNPAQKSRVMELLLSEQSTFVLGAGPSSIRLRPPMDVTVEEIDLLVEKVEKTLKML